MRSVRSLWWQASLDLQSCESRPGQMCPPCSLIEHWDSAHGDLPIPVEKRRLVNESPKLVHEFHIKCCKLTDWTISLWLTNVFTVQRMLRAFHIFCVLCYIDVWHERRKMQELSDPVSMARVHLIQHLQKLSKDQWNILKWNATDEF